MIASAADNIRLEISGGRTTMDRITETLMKEFAQEHGFGSLAPYKQFEHFSAYAVVRREHSETFDTNDVVVGQDSDQSDDGAGSDAHIDGICVLVNGTMITDLDEFNELVAHSSRLEVVFIFIQSDVGSHFDSAKIGSFGFGALDFFKSSRGSRIEAQILRHWQRSGRLSSTKEQSSSLILFVSFTM